MGFFNQVWDSVNSRWRAMKGDTSGRAEVVVWGSSLTGATAMEVQGNADHDAIDSGKPVKIGGKASSSTPTPVSPGDRVETYYNVRGSHGVFLMTQDGATPLAGVHGGAYPAGVIMIGAGESGNAVRLVSVNSGQLVNTLKSSSGLEPNIGGFTDQVASTYGLLTWARHVLFNGSTWETAKSVSTDKNNWSSGLASGAEITVWTPAAGKKFRLRGIAIGVSVAGRYMVRDGGTTRMELRLTVGEHIIPIEANGLLSAAANNALTVYNNTGSAADVAATAWGNEE